MYQKKQTSFQKIVKGLRNLDFSNQNNRIFLADTYRELEHLVKKKHNFNIFQADPSRDFAEDMVKYSQFIKPYIKMDTDAPLQQIRPTDFDKTLGSKIFRQKYYGGRKCFKVKAKIDGQLYQTSDKLKPYYTGPTFNLSLQSEPNSYIIYTAEKDEGLHPLLLDNNDRRVKICADRQQITLPSPCYVCAVAFSNDDNRIESQLTVIKVQRNAQQGKSKSFQNNFGMARPGKQHDMDSSSLVYHKNPFESFNIDSSQHSHRSSLSPKRSQGSASPKNP